MSSPRPNTTLGDGTITLRLATADDTNDLDALAALDSSKVVPHPVLLAEVGGELLAALALSDGATIADPFHATIGLIALLQARRLQLLPYVCTPEL